MRETKIYEVRKLQGRSEYVACYEVYDDGKLVRIGEQILDAQDELGAWQKATKWKQILEEGI